MSSCRMITQLEYLIMNLDGTSVARIQLRSQDALLFPLYKARIEAGGQVVALLLHIGHVTAQKGKAQSTVQVLLAYSGGHRQSG